MSRITNWFTKLTPIHKIWVFTLAYTFIGCVVMAFFTFFNTSLLIGWTWGAFTICTGFAARNLFAWKLFNTRLKKTRAVVYGVLQNSVCFFYYAGSFLALLEVNFFVANTQFFKGFPGLNVVLTPVNVFTFIGGMHVVLLAIFTIHMGKRHRSQPITTKKVVR